MKLHWKIFIPTLILTLNLSAQQTASPGTEPVKHRCGTVAPPAEWDTWFNAKVKNYENAKAQNKTQAVSLTIPVVVHVIHGGQSVGTYPNISQAQIKSQIAVLNKDYAGMGLNSYKLATTGFSVVGAANCLVTFCLAQLDPNGSLMTEPGIDRLNYNTNGWPNPAAAASNASLQSLMDNTIKPASIWDPTQYFNIWVTDENNAVTILGYATFPGGTSLSGITGNLGNGSNDGIWIWAKCFGNTGTLFAPYNAGRTATHETGHWLGLRHIGGDALNSAGDCSVTDYCDDTPPQKGGYAGGTNGQNYGNPSYPLYPNQCTSSNPNPAYGNMFMNFMDYTDDAAMYLFTPDQSSRIQTAMQEGYFRNQMSASSATLCGGAPYADFLLDSILCTNQSINALNQCTGDSPLSYTWTATPSVGVTFSPNNTDANPTFVLPSIGMYTLTTVVSNSAGVSISALVVRAQECTGLNETSQFFKNVSVYPNPTAGVFNLRTGLTNGESYDVVVYNTMGQVVFLKQNQNSATLAIDLSTQAEGVYTISLSSQSERVMKKVIISK